MSKDSRTPLYPSCGMVYDLALMAAQKEYDAWVASRKKNVGGNGITVYSRKKKEQE